MLGDTPLVFLRRWPAGNDPICDDPAISKDHAEQRDWRAYAPHAFGDVATADSTSSARPASYEMYHAARAHRSFMLGGMIVAAIRAVGAIARRVYAPPATEREATMYCQLDDRMLRRLGFDRSEIRSLWTSRQKRNTRACVLADVARFSGVSRSLPQSKPISVIRVMPCPQSFPASSPVIDLAAVKNRQRAAWSTGN
jgi:hypothetical protein